jgi:hypothetical protein
LPRSVEILRRLAPKSKAFRKYVFFGDEVASGDRGELHLYSKRRPAKDRQHKRSLEIDLSTVDNAASFGRPFPAGPGRPATKIESATKDP